MSAASESPTERRRLLDAVSSRAGIVLCAAMLVLAGVVMVAVPWLAWRWSRQPFPAVLFGPSYVVSDMSPAHWEGAQLGLRSPLQLEAVDGVSLRTPFDLERHMTGRQAGERVRLSLKRPDGTRREQVVQLMQIGGMDLLAYTGLPYLVSLAYVAIGVWVYRKRYAHADGRALVVFCACVAVITSAMFENSTSHVLSRLWAACIPLAAGALLELTLVFPQEWRVVKRWPWVSWLPHLLGLGLALAVQPALYDLNAPWAYAAPWQAGLLYLVLCTMLFYARVGYALARSPVPVVRQQSRVILLGSLLAFVPIAFEVIFNLLTHVTLPVPSPLYISPLVFWPLSIAYAVLRYRLWDIGLIVNRGLVYGTLSVLLAGAYVLLLAVLTPLFVWLTGHENNTTIVFVATASLALIFTPARSAVQAAIDRLFYRDRLDLRAAQRQISRALSTSLALDDVVHLLTRQVPQRLRLERATLWLQTPHGLSPYPPDEPLAVEAACLVVPLGEHGLYAVGASLADRPPDREEAYLLVTLGNEAAVTLENVRLAAELAARARIEQEMDIAREIQLSLLPASAPRVPGWDVWGYSQPAAQVGGDFYAYHPLPDGSLGVSVGDVSGKGMPAALLMSGSMIALAAVCEDDPSPSDLLRRMNRVMQSYGGESGWNTALCYARLPAADGVSRPICAANAGMISPLVRHVGGLTMWLNVRGLPLGASEIPQDYAEASVRLEPGDIVVIASDGIVERMNSRGELYGFERFERAVAECPLPAGPEQIGRFILERVKAFAAAWPAHDDMTLVVACAR